jgi:hypothetical protein
MNEIYYSTISGHIIYNYEQYILYIIHDISSFLTLFLFIYLWNIYKYNGIHKIIGRLSLIPLIITIITGINLINNKLKYNSLTSIENKIYSITLMSQGYNFITISLNAFFMKIFINSKIFNLLLIFLHLYDLILGIKSLFLLLWIIFNIKNNRLIETSIELLFILTIPQLINESIYIYIHYNNYNTNYKKIIWRTYHNMSVIFLIYMSTPSILFSIAHDNYWIFSKNIDIYSRLIIMLSPSLIFLFRNISLIKSIFI